MLDAATIESLAARLDEAERTKTLIPMFTKEYPDFAIEDAYAVQRAWTRLQLDRGRVIKGHKIGLTSKAMQSAVGINEPDYGVLFADMFYADATPIPFDRFHAPRIEVELAFVLKAPLRGPDCTIFDVLNATDYVTPALEILETRMHRVDPQTGKTRKVMDTISTTRRMPRWCSAAGRSARWMRICAGSARSCSATARSRRPGLPPACSTIPPMASPGSPIASRR